VAVSLDPKAIFSQLVEGFIRLPLAQKIIIPLLVVGSFSAILFVSKWATQPEFTVLYSDLNAVDSAAVVQRLKDQKIKYIVDGSTIRVHPPEVVHELRMTLASEGVPKSGSMGFELFDSTNLAMTTMGEVVKRMRAIQGELERTVMSLDAVQTARVHITQPEKSVFARDRQEASASVLIRFRPGGELDKKQVRGIANFVAGSVEGLKPENVTIIDVFGNLLTPNDEDGEELGPDATRLTYVREMEKGYANRVEQMLAKVLGPGKVIARVSADIDFSMNEREEEAYDSGGQVIRSERSIEEGVGSSQRGGVPGVVSNLTNDPKLLAPPSAADNNSNRKENVKNYEVSRAVIRSTQPRGKLTRLSAAVLVDGTYSDAPVEAAKDGAAPVTAKKVFQPLPADVMHQVEGLVRTAIGFDSTRGDSVTVENIPFFVPDEDLVEQLDKSATFDGIVKILQWMLPILALLMLFLGVVRPLVKYLITPTEAEVDLTRLLPTGLAELEQELSAERQKAAIPEFAPSVDLEQLGEIMAENSRIVKDNPQQAALLIRYWLNDGRL
jgi:flagellar M-ring protein FliF